MVMAHKYYELKTTKKFRHGKIIVEKDEMIIANAKEKEYFVNQKRVAVIMKTPTVNKNLKQE